MHVNLVKELTDEYEKYDAYKPPTAPLLSKMGLLTLLVACVCLVEVTGMNTTGEETEATNVPHTTEVAVTEEFRILLERQLDDPLRFLADHGFEYGSTDCAWFTYLDKRYSGHDQLCLCLLFLCGSVRARDYTQYELDYRYAQFMKGTEESRTLVLKLYWPYIIVYVILVSVGICGNSTILVVISRFTGKKKSATNVLIANIAVSDLLTCVICMPTQGYIAFYANGFAGRHWFIQGMCKGVYFMYYTSFYCSILTMLAIGFERFLVICYPLKAVSLTSIGNTKRCAALIWIISITIASPVFYIIGQDNGESCRVMSGVKRAFTIFTGFNAVVIFAIPAIILIFLYAKIIYTLHKSIDATLQMRTTSSGDSKKKDSAIDDIRGRKQVMVMLISMLTVFLVTWGPFLVHRFIASFKAVNIIRLDRLLHNVFGAFSFGSATLNPIMIPVNSSQFRIAIKKAYGLQPRAPKRGTVSTATSVAVVL
ncbi:hypothetical protein CAPTEDRAFT_187417 [Capitella teleta]|uniref:G-protein coupled receptors family 1 profile domain-containing protein n=1 Tax=Capitella teleta TaxID=283909 RepID=R7TB55_CAPTE|nr:hypothetical protein CAPTEDRAFT_187417 [Capitella teleta]|eukprot:ELT90732.1 hypothetical protein CAPTEDRAFT_187417 [Capitella teleta]